MTQSEAIATAQKLATAVGHAFVVYRLPAWPPAVFGVLALERGLPREAQTVAQLEPAGAAADDQRSLF